MSEAAPCLIDERCRMSCWQFFFFFAKIMLVYIAVYYARQISNNESKNFSKSQNSIVENLKNQKGEGSLWRKSIHNQQM